MTTLKNYILENSDNKKTNKKENYVLTTHYNNKNKVIGLVSTTNYLKIIKYDENGFKIFEEDSDGNWEKRKYKNGSIIQFSTSSGTHWTKNN